MSKHDAAPIKLAPKLGGEAASTSDNQDIPTIDSSIDGADEEHPVLRLTEDTNDNAPQEDVPPMSEESAAAMLEPPTTPTDDTTNEPAPRVTTKRI